MTGSYKSLVDRLRETRLFYKGDYSIEAADRIEALEAENERLRKALPVDLDMTISALEAWGPQIACGYVCPAAAQTMFVAAQQLKAARAALKGTEQ